MIIQILGTTDFSVGFLNNFNEYKYNAGVVSQIDLK